MGSSRWRGIRALAVLAVTLLTVLALTPTAGAEMRVFATRVLAQLDCQGRGGIWTEVPAPTPGSLGFAMCTFPDGSYIICHGEACVAYTPRKNVQSLLNNIRAVGGREVREPSPGSKVWERTAPTNVNDAVGVMRDGACSSLGGEFFASPDGAIGGCRTPTATVVCQNTTSKNTCSGFADTKKHAASIRKKVQTELKTTSTTTTPGGSTTTTGPTTTAGKTTTTSATTTSTRG
jgi:hypothetical protein